MPQINHIPESGITASWQTPSNIALVKYWGKHGRQLPRNASLSISLKNAVTRTTVKLLQALPGEEGKIVSFLFEGKPNDAFASKVQKYFDSIQGEFRFKEAVKFEIETSNSFPHSAGIASSASAMGAISLCLCELERKLNPDLSDENQFFRKASLIARLGSGSAARSVYGGFTVWGKHAEVSGSSDEYAIPLSENIHNLYLGIKNTILIVEASEKKVSSSAGHNLMNGHPFAEARFVQAEKNLGLLLKALQSGDWNTFAAITENEALSLHAMMMSSNPGYLLIHPNTIKIIDKLKSFREQSGARVCFTLDAGPNLHLLYPEQETEKVQPLLAGLTEFCYNGTYIDDCVGNGPVNLNNAL